MSVQRQGCYDEEVHLGLLVEENSLASGQGLHGPQWSAVQTCLRDVPVVSLAWHAKVQPALVIEMFAGRFSIDKGVKGRGPTHARPLCAHLLV